MHHSEILSLSLYLKFSLFLRFYNTFSKRSKLTVSQAARLTCLCADCFVGVPGIIEGDSLELVNQVQDRDRIPDWEIAGEVNTIRSLLDIHHYWSFVWTLGTAMLLLIN